MIDDYKTTQPIAYKMLKNAVSKEKYSHAYIFETNGFSDAFNLVKAFTKAIICPQHHTNEKDCNYCKVIETENHPEIEIIKPDGLWIKKPQLKELQENFNKKAISGDKKVYIITEANKLNKQAANSILKFLEEPEEGIIAILITDNIYQILETIRSRCQIISLKVQKPISVENTLNNLSLSLYRNMEEENIKKIEKAINFINYYESNKMDTLIYITKLWHDYIKTKEDFGVCFDVIILYYKDMLNYLTNRNIEIFKDYEKEIIEIVQNNNLKKICAKLNTLTDLKEKIKYNINTSLLMDKLILNFEGGKIDDRSSWNYF